MGRDYLDLIEWTSWGALILGALAAWPLGHEWGLGVLSGGVIGLGSLRWLRLGARRLFGSPGSRPGRPLWALGYGVRHVVIFALLAAVLKTGLAHPAGLLLGLLVLPLGVCLGGLGLQMLRE